jgi:hypothetical protein
LPFTYSTFWGHRDQVELANPRTIDTGSASDVIRDTIARKARIVAVVTNEVVAAEATSEVIAVEAAYEEVLTPSTVEVVGAQIAKHLVVATQSVYLVAATRAADLVLVRAVSVLA